MPIRAAFAVALGVAVTGAALFTGAQAQGKSAYDSPYGYTKTWNAALRLVRVDMGMKILEKDDSTGYLLFEYRSSEGGTKPTNGSFEFIRSPDPKSTQVHVLAQLSPMPIYHEELLLNHLARKMRDEYGDPPEAAPASPASPVDAGADGGDDNDDLNVVVVPN
jgi:hypothetical protein